MLVVAPGTACRVEGRRQYGTFFLDDADRDAFVLAWYAVEPDWAAPAVDATERANAVAALVAGTATSGELQDDGDLVRYLRLTR
jgi:hypothetical protein